MAIEIDGPIHLRKREYDNERTKYLERSGMRVIRFRNSDIENRFEWVLQELNSFILNKQSPQNFPEITELSLSPLGETGKGVNNRYK